MGSTDLSEFRHLSFAYAKNVSAAQRWPVLDWHYVESLSIDEAPHPLPLLVAELY